MDKKIIMEAIKSKQNPAVKFAKKLDQKKYRDRESLFIIEGFKGVEEAYRINYPVHALYYSPGIREKRQMIITEVLSRRAKQTFMISDEIMEYISSAKSPQKIMAILPYTDWDREKILTKGANFLALYRVSDPGNLGTIIRSARAFNFDGIMLIGDCVDVYNPRVVRASSGYVLSMPVFPILDMENFIRIATKFNLNSIAFSTRSKVAFSASILPSDKIAYLFGSESSGFEEYEKNVKTSYRIPMSEKVESLNLGVSASIVMEKVFEKSLNMI